MGYDASCTLTIDGRQFRGTAVLEHRDLVFRGPLRLVIPLAAISHVEAVDTTLRLRFGDRDASFEIGTQAAKWARRIAHPPSRLDKLGIKPGMVVAVLGIEDDDFVADLAGLGAVVTRRVPARTKPAQAIFYGASRRDALAKLTLLAAAMRPDGALWVVRPKGVKTITEAETMLAGKRAGLVDVKVVSFSDTHTAEKFVIPIARRPSSATAGRTARKRQGSARK
jgi:hypothetical protein